MTEKTSSGFFYNDYGPDGMEIFSPYSGLFFRVPASDSSDVLLWLNENDVHVDQHYVNTLGWCWLDYVEMNDDLKNFSSPHTLSKWPIVINWMVTGFCNCSCVYCYAKDIVDQGPVKDYKKTADVILSYSPLAIVLSGGEPLTHPFIREIIDYLYGKVGIILDTNGILLDDSIIQFIKERDVVVRMSLDSFNPKQNLKYRVTNPELNRKLISSLNNLLEHDVSVTLHVVLNNENMNDSKSMIKKADLLGIKTMRLMRLVTLDSFEHDTINKYNAKFISDSLLNELRNSVNDLVILYLDNNPDVLNTVILVSPDGIFLTQKDRTKKTPIDLDNLCNPNSNKIIEKVDLWGHMRRYIIQL